MNLLDTVNEIIGLAEIGGDYFGRDVSRHSFGLGDDAINFVDQNNFKYCEAIARAFSSDAEIESTYTLEKYQDLLINYFRDLILHGNSAKQHDVTSFCDQLKSEEKKIFSVFRDIYGITLSNPSSPLLLGEYAVYDFQSHKEAIESKTELKPQYIWLQDTPEYLIEWKAKARHFEKAVEIADRQFERFELVLRYVIGYPTSRFEVGILNYQGWRNRRAYIFSEDGLPSTRSSNHGAIELLPLDNPYIISNEAGYKYVWDLASTNNLNKFQKRIILAIEWIGQSIAELSPQSAFLKSAIALEIIFTYNENTIITPSILNQISEGAALILGESIEERMEIESKVKKLYSLRSAIVHSGNKNISESDHQTMLEVSRAVIIRLLTSKALKSIDSVEKLYELLKRTKYSGGAIDTSKMRSPD
ncbi:HEPN domain-containing protein [Kamptonema animale CS-326]|jgi:hypothetical protein|uniref:HEPN domain-containing protein n=1 Tax=Kamptonema animale TaxID=92934 RepID=UPI00232D60D6|nr:HEPN domain-containing protein [Kamptonema animale]MDB9511147.1 HEPN domain-containing protein [Kamptonema animale CS-326]